MHTRQVMTRAVQTAGTGPGCERQTRPDDGITAIGGDSPVQGIDTRNTDTGSEIKLLFFIPFGRLNIVSVFQPVVLQRRFGKWRTLDRCSCLFLDQNNAGFSAVLPQ